MIGNNDFYTDYATRVYGNLVRNAVPQEEKETTGDFLDEVKEKLDCADRAQDAGNVGKVNVKEMTREQYKQYIYDKISQIPIHPSQNMNSIAVHISESGFEAMQNDPEYEKWVLDELSYNFGFHDPWANLCGGSYTVHTFGATKEDYHGESWFKGYQNGKGQTLFDQKAEDSFWDRRIRHKKLMKEQWKHWQEKKWLEDKRLQRMYEQEMMFRGIEERYRIAGKEYQSPERRLPVISTAYQASMLMDLLLSHSF